MKRTTEHRSYAVVVAIVALVVAALHASEPELVSFDVHKGKVAFDVATNVPALGVHGKSADLEGRARVRHDQGNLVLEEIEAVVPVKTLETGLALRDEHMKKYVFTTPDGKQPDVRFAATRVSCPAVAGGQGSCRVAGELSIRGVARPFEMALKLSEAGGGFRAGGDGVVKLSAYGIDRPSQFGVTTSDEITLHIEFAAKPAGTQVSANARGGR